MTDPLRQSRYTYFSEELDRRKFLPTEKGPILSLALSSVPASADTEVLDHHLSRAIERWNLTEGGH